MHTNDIPWSYSIAVSDIGEDGLRLVLEPNEAERESIAHFAGLRDLPRLSADFELTNTGNGVRLGGRVSAIVGQTCVVTLERVENTIDEEVSLLFTPPSSIPKSKEGMLEIDPEEEPPEAIVDGRIDLARIVVESLMLAIDPYPRKPGAVFEDIHTPSDPSDHPFAALAALKEDPDGADPAKPRRKGS